MTGGAQDLLLAQDSGVTPGGAQAPYNEGLGDRTQVSHVQGLPYLLHSFSSPDLNYYLYPEFYTLS